MNKQDIQALFAFNQWANHRLLAAAESLSPDELFRNTGASYGSVQGTFVHLLWAEWIWLRRWQGESPRDVWRLEDFPTIAALAVRSSQTEREQADFISRLTEERLAQRIAYLNLQNERWEYALAAMMQHVVNHSTYHRGQIVTMLRQLGRTPPATDFLVYFDELSPTP